MNKAVVRSVNREDIEIVAYVEKSCFTKEEAASKEQFEARFRVFGKHFLCIELDNEIIGIINGLVADTDELTDEMYENANIHNENGAWQMVFGLAVLKKYQHKGYASKLLNEFIEKAKLENRKGVVLTCKEELVGFYERFGFESYGVSNSTHANEVWYDMKLKF